MSRESRFHLARIGVAAALAVTSIGYSVLWIMASQWRPPEAQVELGFDADYLPLEHVQLVRQVQKESPAEKAGMRPGDRFVAIDGVPMQDEGSQVRAWMAHKPGESVQLTVQRPGAPAPLSLTGIFRARRAGTKEVSLGERIAGHFRSFFPAPFVLVGFTVLFLRIEDPTVWLLALLFASFAAIPGGQDQMVALAPRLRPFIMSYRVIFDCLVGPLFYYVGAIFPIRSPIDRRLPWLKWAAVAMGLSIAIPGLRTGLGSLPGPIAGWVGETINRNISLAQAYGFLGLGLASLAWNYFRPADHEVRRKIRVIFWGSVVGVVPAVVIQAARDFGRFEPPPWLDTLEVALLFLFPLSFAYAVFKQRVLDIPVLLKRSARYVLVQRGFTFLLSLCSIALTLAFALALARRVAEPSGIALGTVFGTMLLWTGTLVHRRVGNRIDRAFFRSAYDARRIMEDLAERMPMATDRRELALLLANQVREALQPASLTIYLAEKDGQLHAAAGDAPREVQQIPAKLPALVELARFGKPSEDMAADASLAGLHAECLAPLPGRAGRLAGLLVLGARLSEEPYSGEDRRLLAAVATQAGVALENIRLGEEIADRIEVERRTAREMEIARDVQLRLLPQSPPSLRTAECAARCVQARSVGGDYYDFLRLDVDHVGFVLADISGKGVHAALLMANLQAHLRSQSAISPLDPVGLLRKVNRLMWESTAAHHYATLFFGVYDDHTRELVYVNCGHNPPIWLAADGTVRVLEATATVIGVFEGWNGAAQRIRLAPGDLLAVYSDGVTEANRNEEEYGEERLLADLKSHRDLSADELVNHVLDNVQQFSAGTQYDDLTLLVVQSRA